MNQHANASFARIPHLDSLRGIAALLVVFSHLYSIPYLLGTKYADYLKGGFIGADIFFVLSGFLISTLLIRDYLNTKSIRARNFYSRRFLRLLPAMYISVAIFYPLIAKVNAGQAVRDLFYLFTFSAVIPETLKSFHIVPPLYFFSHTWTLSIEVFFYMTYPLLLKSSSQFKFLFFSWWFIGVGFILAVVSLPLSLKYLGLGAFSFPIWHLAEIGMGIIASIIYANLKWGPLVEQLLPQIFWNPSKTAKLVGMINSKHTTALSICFIATVFSIGTTQSPWMYWGGFPVLSISISIIILVAALGLNEHPVLRFILNKRRLQNIGIWSYGIFLYHLPVSRLGDWIANKYSTNNRDSFYFLALLDLIGIIATIALSWFSFHFIESKILKLKRKY